MGRIEKVAGPKHEATISVAVAQFAQKTTSVPLIELPSHIASFPRRWPFPRGDLYHWIAALNRFDEVLSRVIDKYGLGQGPQTKPFARLILSEDAISTQIASTPEECEAKLDQLGFGVEGDRELVESILDFSRLLLEKCGNRSLFSSSERLNALLNSTSLSLVQCTLRLSLCLAQRYFFRQRSSSSTHFHQSLLASHYNIDLERVQKLAAPFGRPASLAEPLETSTPIKGKEKAPDNSPSVTKCNANNLMSLTRGPHDKHVMTEVTAENNIGTDEWEEWANIRIPYYSHDSNSEGIVPVPSQQQAIPTTPTPSRSRSTGNIGSRQGRGTMPDDSPLSMTQSPSHKLTESNRGMKVLEIPSSKVLSTSAEQLVKDYQDQLPQDSKYDLLKCVRSARALTTSAETRRMILGIRLLAITNLAYIYPESIFQQKILQQDSDEPKRLQLAYQLAEFVHLGVAGDISASTLNQSFALLCLDSLTKHKSRSGDVCAALNVNVNHGILMFIIRKAVGELGVESESDGSDKDDWSDALFSLLRTLPNTGTRTPETLVSAGLIPMFVDILNLRTEKARTVYPKVLEFLDNFVHSVRDALATLASAKGFDALSDLISSEVKSAFESVSQGNGLPASYKTPSTDYDIPYFHQQALRWLFKFVNHVMQHNSGGFERLLRNFIDCPPLLSALRLVLENAKVFGSHVWSGAVNIMSHFIHNEPTSYAVIAEAGLSKTFLEAVTGKALEEVNVPSSPSSEEAPVPRRPTSLFNPANPPSNPETILTELSKQPEQKGSDGILPSTDAIVCIPFAFGAICLNSTGLDLFLASDALERFFDIFESPVHVKCMKNDSNLLRLLGNSFDELVRHHPALKASVMSSVLRMVARVGLLGKQKAWECGLGTKLWVEGDDGKLSISGGPASVLGDIGAPYTQDVEVCQKSSAPTLGDSNASNTYENIFGQPKSDAWGDGAHDIHKLNVANYMFPVMRFLAAFFENQSICTNFIESGGVEYVLDFATLQTLPFDFHLSDANHQLAQVIHLMAETKPHLVLPSLVTRTQGAIDRLEEFWGQPCESGFFSCLTASPKAPDSDPRSLDIKNKGTYFAKHLVAVETLTDILREIYTTVIYPTRPTQQPSPFVQANLADKYAKLARSLGLLHATCVWEEILLQKKMPEAWNEATAVPGFPGIVSNEDNGATNPPNPETTSEPGDTTGNVSPTLPQASDPANNTQGSGAQPTRPSTSTAASERGAGFKNVKTLRYLLSSLPSSITGFLHSLGYGLTGKRRMDTYQRQKAAMVADAIASTIIEQLNLEAPNKTSCLKLRFSYLIVILSSFAQLIFDSTAERPHSHCLTMILHAFKKQNGLQKLKDLSDLFLAEVTELSPEAQANINPQDTPARMASAYGGIKIILTFFSEMTSARYIVDSSQTQAMATSERDRERPDFFLPPQFLVELRMEALPLVKEMWLSKFIETASSSIVKSLIDILRSIFEAEYETGAYRLGDTTPAISTATPKVFSVHRDRLTSLTDKGYDEALSREALYRCNNSVNAAEDYCSAQKGLRTPGRHPAPPHDLDTGPTQPHGQDRDIFETFAEMRQERDGGSPAQPSTQSLDDPIASLLGEIQAAQTRGLMDQGLGSETGEATTSQGDGHVPPQDPPRTESSGQAAEPAPPSPERREVVTVEQLDGEREGLRGSLMERCMEVLNTHHDVSFELADLINSAAKVQDPLDYRHEIGETLLHSLLSLQIDGDLTAGGKKISAYANLLALVIQDKQFYEAVSSLLQDNYLALVAYIKIPESVSSKNTDEACPWIGQILLILEKILSDDATPPQIQWNPPNADASEPQDEPAAEPERPIVSTEAKLELLNATIEILPMIRKDESLALSVTRILAMLTRDRTVAAQLGEKRNLQRLFVMIKQLANASNDKLQNTFMLVLRHVVEDEDTIRQIMRNEITTSFESRSPRQTDTTNYVRQFHHLILRNPQLFVEVTNEKVKIQRYDSSQRPQGLVIKTEKKEPKREDSGEVEKLEEGKAEGSKAPAENQEAEQPDTKGKEKPKELKAPIVEHPDGVIHYLLSELLSYRDINDRDPPADSATEGTENQTEDVEMASSEPSQASTTPNAKDTPRKRTEKPQFKAEDHPIYIYRCFILQCLTELLSSYNRTKVEFINFSRKADPLASTPSKPRSTVLNYLLSPLIPIGTLEHDDSVSFKKKVNTSNWAMRVVVALCSKTGEFGGPSKRHATIEEEEESDLTFVRRFVLEHALKSYKDANLSQEPLDVKYARLMSLADLFDKMLSGSSAADGTARFPSSTRQIAKTMFEKNFISAFTASVADIDLNFPSSKRAVKYILRPLNKLTQTAVLLSETSSISTVSGHTDDDEISSATSVSDLEDEREETPDLFRHSTLGMFEPQHEEETSSDEDEEDEEMYDDEYDDEMEYDEDMPENDGEVVSDEDEDIDGRGPIEGLPGDTGMDIEVLIGSGESDSEDEDDEDDEDDDESDMSGLDDRIVGGEITGDHDNDSLQDGDEGEWESDISGDEDDADMMNQLENELDDMAQGDRRAPPHLDNLLRVLEETGGSVEQLDHGIGIGRDLGDDMLEDDMHDEDDEDDEVDELEDELDEFEEDGRLYGRVDDDDAEGMTPPWGWDEPVVTHNRMPSRNIPSWNFFPGQLTARPGGVIPVPSYRTHRTQIPQTRNDDGANPLLRRDDRPAEQPGQRPGPNTEAFSDWVHAMDPSGQGRVLSIDSPVTFMNAIMQVIGQGGPEFGIVSRPDGIHVHLDRGTALPGRLQDLFGLGRPQVVSTRLRDDPAQAVTFTVGTTANRWQEESRLLFGSLYLEKAQRVLKSLLKVLVPPAIEEEKLRLKQIEEERKKFEEERIERERKERIAREEAEKEQKRKEEEEAELERQREAERSAEESARQDTEPMEDVQPTEPREEEQRTTETGGADAGPSEPAERVHTTIRGRQLDITGMDIDPEYLEALPEEIREEVIMQQLAEQRSHAAAAGEEPSEINPEFLEALPAEIRDELLQQEAADRRRRERESARRQAATAGTPHAEDMDPASFIATLDPSLRQTVLADQPEEVLATLGPEFVTEARALTARRLPQFGEGNALETRAAPTPGVPRQNGTSKKPPRRQIVQMLDKAGVATLLRLMFMPLQGNARHHLNDILHNVCQNRQNRSEVISLLLLILQDGSADISAVERSFAHLSLRAKTPSAQKTPQSVKRTLSMPVPGANSDVTPLIVIQQCLGALSFLTQYNPHIAWFFLTEHDSASSLKLKALRKGKNKENRANKFALNSLLSLLDRKAILDSPNCMEQLSSLLSSITQPLTILLKKDKEKQEEETKEEKKTEDAPEPSTEGEPQNRDEDSGAAGDSSTQGDTSMVDTTTEAPAQDSEERQEEPASSSNKDDEAQKRQAEEEQKKKPRVIEPPAIPEHNLQLVVRILASRECNGKTFRETLSTINNLSSIPGAKEAIGRELVSQGQVLSKAILVDLDELLPHIMQAKAGTDVQGVALSKFSPASSDQAKLLRVLTALDYLFDPSRAEKDKISEAETAEKEDVLKSLYESVTFGPLWTKLSDCLHAIQQKEKMLNVATTLLPLIESLMVVCKNTTLKDLPLFPKQGREFSVSSPPPESGMEGLFFNFTEDHRKILNELVRQNPRLMSGTFSLLVKNPKVLEFDNKRNYFNRRIHSRGTEARHPHPPLQLSVRRDQVFLDSFKSLYFKSADEMKYGKLNIRFHGEEGVDAGGVTREWFQVLARGMFNPDYALFIPVASDRTTFHPNRLSGVNQEHLMFFKFIGRVIGKALYEGRVLDCHFSRAVYKRILSKSVSIKDMETLDLDYYKSLLWMLENDITDIITENFSVEVEDFGETRVIDLVENGRNIPVTQENKEEYVQRVVEHRLTGSVKEQLDHFLRGFHDIIPAELIAIFNEQELELLISGMPEIDVDDWKNTTEYHNYSASSPQIQWFWRAVRSFDKEGRAKLLQFVTGTSKVPLNGFSELEGMNGFSRFNIHRDYGSKDRLPSSHTCFNQLDLPEYDSYEALRKNLYTAMTAGSEYFGFA